MLRHLLQALQMDVFLLSLLHLYSGSSLLYASGIYFFDISHSMNFLGALSNAFSISTKHMFNLFCFARYSCNLLKIKIASIVPLPGIKPNYISSYHYSFSHFFLKYLLTIFITCSINFAPLCMPLFMTPNFSAKILFATFSSVCLPSYPFSILWQGSTYTLIPISSLCRTISA